MIHGIDFEKLGDVSGKVAKECFLNGMIIERAGRNDCVLKLMPALTIEEDELLQGLEIIENAMKRCWVDNYDKRRTFLQTEKFL
jgi:diaminobutyrate-2-oxoglutarate transaminase